MKTEEKPDVKGRKKLAFGESELLMKELMSKELKDKLIRKIDEEDPAVISAIKTLLSESE